MESKTIRVKRHPNALNRYDSADGSTVIMLSGPAFVHEEFVITPIASPEERLREARMRALVDARLATSDGSFFQGAARLVLEVIERVDAEFAREKP